jgi:hypothetical protein
MGKRVWKERNANLQDDRVSCGESRSDFPCPHEDFCKRRMRFFRCIWLKTLTGEVPCDIGSDETRLVVECRILTWNDLAYNTDGFMTSIYQFSLIGLIKTHPIGQLSVKVFKKSIY